MRGAKLADTSGQSYAWRERHLRGRPLVLIFSQPAGEAVCESLSLLGEVKYDSNNDYAIILMEVEDRCLVSALVEPYAHRAHLIAKIGPIQKDFHRVQIRNSALPWESEHSCMY
jgi:hypothetical protein